ncbi:MAG: baseplate wedge protein [Flavobacteriaceae bacterium]|nr:baseplate wedge protein [Flavobacteriaceae bacterium]
MAFTQYTNLDFDQIKAQIKDYLRTNSNFTDFDFEGSNFSVLIDTLAYNTYINSFNANLLANESFLDSATLRENVISLARNIGYVPRSKTASRAQIYFTVELEGENPDSTLDQRLKTIYLKPGLVCVGKSNDTTFTFSLTEDISAPAKISRVVGEGSARRNIYSAEFGTAENPIEIVQGSYLQREFTYLGNQDQRFILENSSIDSSTIKVIVGSSNADIGSAFGMPWRKVDNIVNVDNKSEIYFLQEITDEKQEIIFGDGIIGKQLGGSGIGAFNADGNPLTNNKILVRYIVCDGEEGNGASQFDFQGGFLDKHPDVIGANSLKPYGNVSINTVQGASNGAEVENLASIKYYAPRLYSSQYRAVTSTDYESIIETIYPSTESVAVVGGEELSPPQFGKVQISIKPKNGTYVSDFDKLQIKNKLKNYAVAGINADIVDLKVLYVELHSTVYYNTAQNSNGNSLKGRIVNALETYANNIDINKFGGRFKYSKILQLIDRVDDSITSNITKVIIRRDLKVLKNQFAQYELCFGNRFYINPEGFNIKSTGFTINGSTSILFLTDVPNKKVDGTLDGSGKGTLSAISRNQKDELNVIVKSIGTIDYVKGEIILNTVNITSTIASNDLIEIQAFPDSNDVIGLKDLYLNFNTSNTTINMIKDVIASGEDVSGVVFSRDYYTSSYSNGELERK